MYQVKAVYAQSTRGENKTYETLEEAVAHAEEEASMDVEDYTYLVSEIKVIVKSDRPKNPVKTAVVTEENFKALLLEGSGDDE